MIKVELTDSDPIFGKKKICTHQKLEIISDECIIHQKMIQFVESDGGAVETSNQLTKQAFMPKVIRESSLGRTVHKSTGLDIDPSDPDAVDLMAFLKSIPLSALPADITTVWGAIQWMVEQRIIAGHIQGKY